jgi:hypothetical protein
MTPSLINTGGAWQTARPSQVWVGGAWQPVTSMSVYTGGAWHTEYGASDPGPPGSAFSVMSYGAHANGTTDDTDHFTSAANAAIAANGHVLVPSGTYRLNAFDMPAGVYVYSPSATIRTGRYIGMNSTTTWDGGTLVCYSDSCAFLTWDPIDHVTIKNCTFNNNSTTNQFDWATVLFYGAHDCTVSGCTFNGVSALGSCIQVLGGGANSIHDNVCAGGVTSIAHLYSRSANGGGALAEVHDSEIYNNTCSDFSEEGITFDVIGNAAADVATLEVADISSVGSGAITLPQQASAYATLTGYKMCFLTGTLAGRTRAISSQSGTKKEVFALSGDLTGAQANDTVVIGGTFQNVYIHDNHVTGANSGSASIKLYGMAFGCRIESNHVILGTIYQTSIDNCIAADISKTGRGGRALCGYNNIKNNTLDDGDITLEYWLAPDGPDDANAAYTSKGTNVMNNTVGGVVNADYQWFYASGNSGTTHYTHYTLSGSEMA